MIDRMTPIIIRNVPASMRRALKIAAAREGKTMSALIVEAISARVGVDTAGNPKPYSSIARIDTGERTEK